MILNELSADMHTFTRNDVRIQMSDFLRMCQMLSNRRDDKTFYYDEKFMSVQLCDNYTIHDWFKDSEVPMKEKQFGRVLIHRGNPISSSDYLGEEVIIERNGEKMNATGCLAAYESDNDVVSFCSDEIWIQDWLTGIYQSLSNDGEILNRKIKIPNHYSCEQIMDLEIQEKERIRINISSGQELWEKKEELFPHLLFCEAVKKQLEEPRVSLWIQAVMKRLQILEDYFATYDGTFNKDELGYNCRFESESVQNDSSLREERRFRTPYGKEEYFYWHISFAGNYPGRIHFLPDKEHLIGIVGYIGKHLPTKRYSTS